MEIFYLMGNNLVFPTMQVIVTESVLELKVRQGILRIRCGQEDSQGIVCHRDSFPIRVVRGG